MSKFDFETFQSLQLTNIMIVTRGRHSFNVIMDILNHAEKQVRPVHGAWKIVPIVEAGGHCIYKSTLVLQLSGNHFFSPKIGWLK